MQAQQHQGQNLDYITITPDDYDPARSYPPGHNAPRLRRQYARLGQPGPRH